MELAPNCVYIIQPNCDMALMSGHLHLFEPAAPRGQRLPIDFFFRSLADDCQDKAICIVLSGSGSDGTQGVRAVKGVGGMVMAQSLESAEYDSMPSSALATGLVDFELSAAEMPNQLVDYVSHAFSSSPLLSAAEPKSESIMKKIFILLRAQTGNDFSQYKPNTINRRIERRMAVNRIEKIEDYLKFLQSAPTEVEALFRDILIGVTSFFRDPDAFLALEEQIIPTLFAQKPSGATIRVWSAGCSTGEEAYSIAILLQEHMEKLKKSYILQIFATDIDARAIASARTGIYPLGIAADVTPQRLARFFTLEPDGSSYRIQKGIRDMLVFSEQNVVKDPPFSKLDLLSCRNLLIYLNGDLQKKIIPLFHYALNPDGILFLGTSENVGNFENLYSVLDRKAKLYGRKEAFFNPPREYLNRFLSPVTAVEVDFSHKDVKAKCPPRIPLRELTEQNLLQQVGVAGALVNGIGDILYLHGSTGKYLELAPGESGVNNIIKMARKGLQRELSTALHKAVVSKDTIQRKSLKIETNGYITTFNLAIRPVAGESAEINEQQLYLVMLEDAPPATERHIDNVPVEIDCLQDNTARIQALKHELREKEEYLQAANEQLETSNEELKSSNEEMQSVNEELQSTNEELETSKEELQSVNEELATVNAELQSKVADLSHVNDDMNNLLAGTGIATVFVDFKMRIMRFTPTITQIINLIPNDLGRSITHFVSNLVGYNNLVADVQAVLDKLVPKEIEVTSIEGKFYSMCIQPYRTLDNIIEGAVLTFVDISDRKELMNKLNTSEVRYRRLFEAAQEGILILDAETGMIMNVNPYLIDMLGYSENQFIKKSVWDIGFFKDIEAIKDKFSELQEKSYIRFENLPLETAIGRRIEVEFIGSLYLVDNQKVIQCAIRESLSQLPKN